VLVVEDNAVVADAVAEGLRDQGMAVDVAYDGPSGLEKTDVNTYDVLILDRDLPGLTGDKLCAHVAGSPCPSRVLMLTAAGEVEDRVEGLNLGADDYLAKPFDFSELVARVRALGRRSPSTPPVLTRGDLVVDRPAGSDGPSEGGSWSPSTGSRAPHGAPRKNTSTNGSASTGPTTSSKNSPIPSTTCWTASTSPLPASAGSWPTRRTNCGLRSPPCAP